MDNITRGQTILVTGKATKGLFQIKNELEQLYCVKTITKIKVPYLVCHTGLRQVILLHDGLVLSQLVTKMLTYFRIHELV